MRVAIVTTHPIQYQVPWIQRLAASPGMEILVFFAMLPDAAEQGREFGVSFQWDVPLLEGYRYKVLENRAKSPSLTEFRGCDTPQVYGEILSGHFDAVIVNGWVAKTCIQALAACRASRTPCVVRGEVNGLTPRPVWKRAAHRALISQYAAVLAIGTHNRNYYLAAGVPEHRIFETPYCVDNDRFAAAANKWRCDSDAAALRARFGLSAGKSTFLFSGKLVDKKRPMDLVEAAGQAGRAGAAMQVLVVGDGPLGAALRDRARGLPVYFTGFLNQSEISAAYAAADCLVLPSDHGETWGLVVNEAMASGIPAVVSDQVGCAVDLVTTGETGDIFRCGHVDALSRVLVRLSADPSQLKRMGQHAQERVQTSFNFDRVVLGVLEALGSVAKGRTRA